jgi:hypothetical protein
MCLLQKSKAQWIGLYQIGQLFYKKQKKKEKKKGWNKFLKSSLLSLHVSKNAFDFHMHFLILTYFYMAIYSYFL